MLALSFLLLIDFALLLEGFGQHVPEGYIYFARALFVFVELPNLRVRRCRESRRSPVKLHRPYVREREPSNP